MNFIEFVTTKKEPVCLNVNRISYITEHKEDSCIIFDVEGFDFYVAESYSSFVQRVNEKIGQKV